MITKDRQSFSLSIPTIEKVRKFSEETGIPISKIAELALREWLAQPITLDRLKKALKES